MRRALAGSAVLHVAIGAACLMTISGRPPAEIGPLEVELIEQPPTEQGASAAQPPQPVAQPPERSADSGDIPAAPPSAPIRPRQRAAAAVNLGNAPEELEPLSVRGENIVPPAPDALYRNKPPVYPAAAARAGAHGTVQLAVRVSAAGVPDQVVVAQSSGWAALDGAARDAVQLWHFRPARAGGQPVPFDYAVNIRFSLGDR